MSEHRETEDGGRGEHGRFGWFWLIVTLVVALVGAKEALETTHNAVEAVAKLKLGSMFTVNQQLQDRMQDCNYRLMVLCASTKSQAAKLRVRTTAPIARVALAAAVRNMTMSEPTPRPLALPYPLNLVAAGAITLPRLPGAFVHVLAARWKSGALEFLSAVLYVMGYVTVIVLGFRWNVLAGFLAIVFGGLVCSGAFWLMQHLIDGLDVVLATVASWLILTTSIPGLALICLPHQLASVREAFAAIGKLTSRS